MGSVWKKEILHHHGSHQRSQQTCCSVIHQQMPQVAHEKFTMVHCLHHYATVGPLVDRQCLTPMVDHWQSNNSPVVLDQQWLTTVDHQKNDKQNSRGPSRSTLADCWWTDIIFFAGKGVWTYPENSLYA
jgi:hypothetical protein